MKRDQLHALADRIGGAPSLYPDLAVAPLDELREALPQARSDLHLGVVESTGPALQLVARVSERVGRPVGHRTRGRGPLDMHLAAICTRDNEEVIGIGRAPTPPLAVIAALLRGVVTQARGYA